MMMTMRLMKVPNRHLFLSARCPTTVYHVSSRASGLRVSAKGQGENSESVSRQMTEEEARSILGVTDDTSFEQIVKIKNKLLTKNASDEQRLVVQGAYDLLLMKSMTRRVKGSEEVPSNVRFADVRKIDLTKEARNVISKLPTGGVAIESPSTDVLRVNSIVFGLLAIYILPQGFSDATLGYDAVPGIQLAFAFAWSIYSYRQYKLLGFGRSLGYTFAGLVAGAVIGGAIEGVLHVHDHPLGGFHSPAALISEFSVLGMWACAIFLS